MIKVSIDVYSLIVCYVCICIYLYIYIYIYFYNQSKYFVFLKRRIVFIYLWTTHNKLTNTKKWNETISHSMDDGSHDKLQVPNSHFYIGAVSRYNIRYERHANSRVALITRCTCKFSMAIFKTKTHHTYTHTNIYIYIYITLWIR